MWSREAPVNADVFAEPARPSVRQLIRALTIAATRAWLLILARFRLIHVPSDPLPNRVVGHAVFASHGNEAHVTEVGCQLLVRRPRDLPALRPRTPPTKVMASTAVNRAVSLLALARLERLPAPFA